MSTLTKTTKTKGCSTYQAGDLSRMRSAFPTAAPRHLPILIGLACFIFSPIGHSEFAMNFSGVTSTSIVHGTSGVGGQSPFTPTGANQAGSFVTDPTNGLNYWHYILGDPATGFAQEVYIQATGGNSCGDNSICTASGGSALTPTGASGGNPVNFLGSNSAVNGTATANPSRVIVHQVLGGTWDAGTSTWTCDTAYCSEFIKSSYADKPKITEGINEPDFTSTFILDMSGIALSNNSTNLTLTDKNTAPTGSSLTNVQTVIDPTNASTISFDMAHDSQSTNVNGGKYTYTNGGGTLGSSGNYVYVDGGFNPRTIDYTPFLDETVSNPWAYPDTKP